MSQENAKLGYLLSDAFNRRDLEAFLALTDPDVEVYSPSWSWRAAGPTGATTASGAWKDVFGIVPDLTFEVEDVRDIADVTVARIRQRGRGAGSDAPIEQTQWIVTKWRDKKAIWWHVLLSETEALEAAGLQG